MAESFYVYEHLRADTNAVFYVGKGIGRRAFQGSSARRSEWWNRIVRKAGDFSVRMVATQMDEELAHLVEVERIAQLRAVGIDLCNQTDGGDGTTGHKRSASWCAQMSAVHKGKVVSEETKRKIAESVKAAGYRHPTEVNKAAAKKRAGMKPMLGKTHSEETRQKMSASRMGNPSRSGQTRSIEERAKVSATMTGRPQAKMTCPHCGKVGGNIMRRYHFEACKERK